MVSRWLPKSLIFMIQNSCKILEGALVLSAEWGGLEPAQMNLSRYTITMRRRHKLIFAILGFIVLAVAAYLKHEPNSPSNLERTPPAFPGSAHAANPRVCIRVIDGDTIELDGGERVRLIGVNTPETVDPRRPVERFGKEASSFTRRLAEGKTVRLELGDETRDRYGRTLGYIYLPDDTLLNAEIIRQGYGYAYTRFPYRRMDEFVELEREARDQGRGLWGK